MLKIAVFGFYSPDDHPAALEHRSPVSTEEFMRAVWEMEPPEKRIGTVSSDGLGFVKLTTITRQPVYVQSLADGMADSAGLLNFNGYIAIIDALKVLAPRAIESALRRLAELQPRAHLIIAAGRQNEAEALSCEDVRAVLGLNPDLLVMPYVPSEPKTVQRLVRRMVRYIDNPDRVPPPIFADGTLPSRVADEAESAGGAPSAASRTPAAPRVHGLDHVAIAVSDLERALAFYQGVLGFRVLGQIDLPDGAPGHTIVHLDTGRGLLVLISGARASGDPDPASGGRAGLQHIALRVTRLDALFAPLQSAGVRVLSQPTDLPYGPRAALVADPDGTLIELVEGQVVYTRR